MLVRHVRRVIVEDGVGDAPAVLLVLLLHVVYVLADAVFLGRVLVEQDGLAGIEVLLVVGKSGAVFVEGAAVWVERPLHHFFAHRLLLGSVNRTHNGHVKRPLLLARPQLAHNKAVIVALLASIHRFIEASLRILEQPQTIFRYNVLHKLLALPARFHLFHTVLPGALGDLE